MTTGILWAAALAVMTFASISVPYWLLLSPGFVLLWLVGRRDGLEGGLSWFMAGAGAVLVAVLIWIIFAFFWTLAGFPGVGRY